MATGWQTMRRRGCAFSTIPSFVACSRKIRRISAKRQSKTRFAEFVASLFDRKVKAGEIRSARGREKWATVLKHLIDGMKGRRSGMQVAGFGEFFVDRLQVGHVEKWKTDVAALIAAGDYKPTTCNGWLGAAVGVVAGDLARSCASAPNQSAQSSPSGRPRDSQSA